MIKDLIQNLIRNHFVVGLKVGTEVEDCSFEEILDLQSQLPSNCLFVIKIGGVEARNDIRFALHHRIDKILAPMVETVYGFENFINTILELEKELGVSVKKAINLETETGISHLSKIVENPLFSHISSVTIGRGDLSASMKLSSVNDPKVQDATAYCVKLLAKAGKEISIGGSINKDSVKFFKSLATPIFFNTRNVILKIDPQLSNDIFLESINKALEFEMALCTHWQKLFPLKKEMYEKRIKVLEKRL
jgi:hypothetical protein